MFATHFSNLGSPRTLDLILQFNINYTDLYYCFFQGRLNHIHLHELDPLMSNWLPRLKRLVDFAHRSYWTFHIAMQWTHLAFLWRGLLKIYGCSYNHVEKGGSTIAEIPVSYPVGCCPINDKKLHKVDLTQTFKIGTI
jgi:hypothetical protein